MDDDFLAGWQLEALKLAPMMVRDRDGNIRAWSAGMTELYGYDSVEAVGQQVDDLLATTFPVSRADILAKVRLTGQWRGEVVHLRRDGRAVAVETRWSGLNEPGGPLGTIVVYERDITSHRDAEQDRRFLASIVEGSHDAIIGKSLDGLVTTWNSGAEEMFGYTAREIIGQPILRLIPTALIDEERMILERLRRGERVENYETVRRRKDDTEIQVSLSVSPIRDAAGRVVGASKIARDITEQKLIQSNMELLQAELTHTCRMSDMGHLALGIAHELNQPLSAVANYLSGVRRLIEAGDVANAIIGCAKASEQLMRAGEVVRRLRDFVKKGDRARRTEPLALVIEEACGLALMGPMGNLAKVRMAFSPEAPAALIDRIQIQQVIINLVRNAVEAMADAPQRSLTILTASRSPGLVEVSVGDTGPGLAPGFRQRLFQPFQTTKPTGMGVGLSLCRTIVEAHGGTIWADDNPAGGAVFCFTLPRPDDQPTA